MKSIRPIIFSIVVVALVSVAAIAQRRSRQAPQRTDYETWEIAPQFKDDVFTFVRIRYGGGGWSNDYPDCDWNFSVRLHQLTSIAVHPNGKVMRLTDPDLLDYPFIFMSNVQTMYLSAEEMVALRHYLLNGGFLLADDFWTPDQWRHVARQMKQVLPNHQPRELTLDHDIFHLVYDLKEIPQIPSIFAWRDGYSYEPWHGDYEGDTAPHFQGYFDDHGRLMALFCHNNDVGDGWEREGENRDYFEKYSVKVSYPLGVNIVTYALTH